MIPLKTSDLALCAEVSTATVRDYSDKGLLGPVYRSKSSAYRAFDLRVIPQIHLVKTLREMGLTMEQVNNYAQNRTPEKTVQLFRRCSAQLSGEIAALQTKLDMLQSHTAFIEEGRSAKPGIQLRTLPAQAIRCSALESYSLKTKSLTQQRRAHGSIRYNGNAGCPLGFAYNDFLDLLDDPERPALLLSFDPQGSEIRPAGEYLVGTVACYYGEKNSLAQRMYDHSLRNGLELCGPTYTVFLHDGASVTESECFLMQIAVGVKRMQQDPEED